MDRSLASLWSLLDPERDLLVAVSDHGHLPIHDELSPNLALAEFGLVNVEAGDGDRPWVAPSSPMVAVSAGAATHIYLNLQGRDTGGVVDRSEAGELLLRAAKVLADLEVDGRPVVEKAFARDELAGIGLDHPSSGDLVVFLPPDSPHRTGSTGDVLTPTRYYGQHGFLASHDGVSGMLFARGIGIKKKRVDELPATAVAPLIAQLLGITLSD